jgi:hypothetical protein
VRLARRKLTTARTLPVLEEESASTIRWPMVSFVTAFQDMMDQLARKKSMVNFT